MSKFMNRKTKFLGKNPIPYEKSTETREIDELIT
jgi:hypothetical protein